VANAAPLTSGAGVPIWPRRVTASERGGGRARTNRVNLGFEDRLLNRCDRADQRATIASCGDALGVTKPVVEPLDQILRGLGDYGAWGENCICARLA
jgi:hypothetical protein